VNNYEVSLPIVVATLPVGTRTGVLGQVLKLRTNVIRRLLVAAVHDAVLTDLQQFALLDSSNVRRSLAMKLRDRSISVVSVVGVLNGVTGMATEATSQGWFDEPMAVTVDAVQRRLDMAPDVERRVDEYRSYMACLHRAQPMNRVIACVAKAKNGPRGQATAGNGYLPQVKLAELLDLSDVSRRYSAAVTEAAKTRLKSEPDYGSINRQTRLWASV
jgi:hypothetical protein